MKRNLKRIVALVTVMIISVTCATSFASAKDYYFAGRSPCDFSTDWSVPNEVRYNNVYIGNAVYGYDKATNKDYCKCWVADYHTKVQISEYGKSFHETGWNTVKSTWSILRVKHQSSNVIYFWLYRT